MPIASAKSHDRRYLDSKYMELETTIHEIFPNLANIPTVSIIRKMVFSTTIGFYPKPSMNRSNRPDTIALPRLQNLYFVGDGINRDGI
jgi:hypothetical protein